MSSDGVFFLAWVVMCLVLGLPFVRLLMEKHHVVELRATVEALRSVTGKRHRLLYCLGSNKLAVRKLDRIHPRSLEIKEHKMMLRELKNVAGDDYMSLVRPRLDALQELRRAGDEAHVNTFSGKLTELNRG